VCRESYEERLEVRLIMGRFTTVFILALHAGTNTTTERSELVYFVGVCEKFPETVHTGFPAMEEFHPKRLA
jgi:hypothetical protein